MSTKAAVAVTAATSVASTTWRQGRWTYLERTAGAKCGLADGQGDGARHSGGLPRAPRTSAHPPTGFCLLLAAPGENEEKEGQDPATAENARGPWDGSPSNTSNSARTSVPGRQPCKPPRLTQAAQHTSPGPRRIRGPCLLPGHTCPATQGAGSTLGMGLPHGESTERTVSRDPVQPHLSKLISHLIRNIVSQ